MNITKIVIQSESGYCPVNLIYKDKLTVTSDGLKYLYQPYIESDTNPVRKWKYTTNSPIYAHLYHLICENTSAVVNLEEKMMKIDAGVIKITVTYADSSKVSCQFTENNDILNNYFRLIKKLIPDLEYMPAMLASKEDESI